MIIVLINKLQLPRGGRKGGRGGGGWFVVLGNLQDVGLWFHVMEVGLVEGAITTSLIKVY